MPTIKAGELLQKLKKNGVNITRVDEISIARKNLGHDNFDATEMTAEEAALVEDYFAKNNPASESQPKVKKTNNKALKKTHVKHEDMGLAIAQATDEKNKSLINTGIATGAQDANLIQQGYATGLATQFLRNTQGNAAAIAQQLLAVQDASYDRVTIEASDVLLLPPAEDGDEDPLELDLYKQPAGLGFGI